MRKDPYRLIKVNETIYEELIKRREGDSKEEFKVPSMNAYIEGILWAYAKGEIERKEKL